MTNLSGRCYGADLLKILAMFMVVILHILGQGGILLASQGTQYYVAWFLEAFAYCAVNCFALVSGYVQIKNTKLRFKRIFILWFQVVCLSSGITLIFYLSGNTVMDITNIKNCLFPVLSKDYWYFNAYFILFFLIPYINIIFTKITLKEHRTLAGVVAFVILINYIGAKFFGSNTLILNEGYSFLWITLMYVLGTWMKRDEAFLSHINAFVWVTLLVVCVILAALDYTQTWGLGLLNYTSPAILGSAICLSELMLKINVSSPRLRKHIVTLSKLSFGVYIIHCQWLIWSQILKDAFISYIQLNPFVMILAILGTGAVIYLICTAIDYIRDKVFSLIPFLHCSPTKSSKTLHVN